VLSGYSGHVILNLLKRVSIIITAISLAFFIIFFNNKIIYFVDDGKMRLASMFASNNNFGQFLSFAFVLFNFYKRNSIKKIYLYSLNITVLIMLFFSDSMTSIFIIGVCYFIAHFSYFKKTILILLLVIGISLPVVYYSISSSATNDSIENFKIGNRNATFTGRSTIWVLTIKDLVEQNKLVSGFGYGRYWNDNVSKFAFSNVRSVFSEDIKQAHNGYVEMILKGGIISLLLLLLFLNRIRLNMKLIEGNKVGILTLLYLIILSNNITEASFFCERHFYFILLLSLFFISLKSNKTIARQQLKVHI
jgi:O-antigen ligase